MSAPRRALAWPDLRPYLRAGGLARAWAAGSVVLGRKGCAYIAAGKDWKAKWCRFGGVLVGIGCAAEAVAMYPATAPCVLLVSWSAVSLAVSPTPSPAPPGCEASPDGHPEAPKAEVIPASEWVRLLIGNANGIHLTDLLDAAHHNGQHLGLDYAAFKAALEARGIPVRKNLKVAGRNRPGIALADLPLPPPQPLSPGSLQEGADSQLPVA